MACEKADVMLTIPMSRDVYRRLIIEPNMLNRNAGDVARDLIVTAFNTGELADLMIPIESRAANAQPLLLGTSALDRKRQEARS